LCNVVADFLKIERCQGGQASTDLL
jgi:hypothetical protein